MRNDGARVCRRPLACSMALRWRVSSRSGERAGGACGPGDARTTPLRAQLRDSDHALAGAATGRGLSWSASVSKTTRLLDGPALASLASKWRASWGRVWAWGRSDHALAGALSRGSRAAAEVSGSPWQPLRWRKRGSASAWHHLETLDGQQAGLPKAAAGCRSPCGSSGFEHLGAPRARTNFPDEPRMSADIGEFGGAGRVLAH